MRLPGSETGPLERWLRLDRPFDSMLTLGPLRRGRRDPTVALHGAVLWRATRTPEGPATQAVVSDPANGGVRAWAWGPGATWVLESLGELVGVADSVGEFEALCQRLDRPAGPRGAPVVAALSRRHRGLRIPRTKAVAEACVATVIEQKVTSVEARGSYRDLVLALGEAAPGTGVPASLLLPPAPARLAATPAWVMHPWGIESRRAETLRRVASAAARLEEAVGLPAGEARRRLRSVVGIGAWSAAEVALVALGDPDAVSIGDFHLPNQIAWALTGSARGDDASMLELLEPWRGHRGRVLRLVAAAGITAPRFGPRHQLRAIRSI